MPDNTVEARDIFENLADGESVTLKVQGVSMQPFLYNGRDTVTLKKNDKPVKRGDVVIFERGGIYLMHRIVEISADGYFIALGDYSLTPETHIPLENIKAVLVSAVRNGKTITPKSPEWIFFSRIFIYTSFRKLLKKGGK